MSDISETARALVLVADVAKADSSGKLNLLGAGVAITGLDPQTGQSAPFSVVVIAQVEPRFRGQQYALELALYDDAGEVFVPPGPIENPPVRVAQVVSVEPVHAPPGTYLPADTIWIGSQMVVNFQNGLALTVGRAYEWRVSIDQNLVAATGLYMAGPPPGPVVG